MDNENKKKKSRLTKKQKEALEAMKNAEVTKDYIDEVKYGDSDRNVMKNQLDMTDEEYDTPIEEDEITEEEKYAKNRGPGGIKLTDEQLEEAAKMLAEVDAYIKSKDGIITPSDLSSFEQDAETIKEAYRAVYKIQKARIAFGNRCQGIVRLAAYKGEKRYPLAMRAAYHYLMNAEELLMENLGSYASQYPASVWAQSICGIGPVFAASLVAILKLGNRKYAGNFWSYAGLTGNPEWDVKKKGKSISYNPDLKTLCFKIGTSFIKQQKNEKDIYGKVYAQMVDVYNKRNEAGGFKELAERSKAAKNWKKDGKTYKTYCKGKLPSSHINSMARRYAEKRFLAHLFEAMWKIEHYHLPDTDPDKRCPDPYVEAHLGHHDIIHAPNLYLIDEWFEQEEKHKKFMENIDKMRNENEGVSLSKLVTPENEVQEIITDSYKKSTSRINKNQAKMMLKVIKTEKIKNKKNDE